MAQPPLDDSAHMPALAGGVTNGDLFEELHHLRTLHADMVDGLAVFRDAWQATGRIGETFASATLGITYSRLRDLHTRGDALFAKYETLIVGRLGSQDEPNRD